MSNETYIRHGLKIVDSSGNVVANFDSNGFQSIRYRDEYVGGDWVAAAGAAAPDLVNYTIAGLGTRMYSYDGGVTEERMSNSFEIPHDIALDEVNAETLDIEMHIHWMPSDNTAGDVEWFADLVYFPVNGAPESLGTLSVVTSVAINQQYYHKLSAFLNGSAVAKIAKPSTGFQIGGVIHFNVRRTPTGANDTYGSDAIMIKAAIHVPVNDTGSRQLYIN